MCIIIAVGIIIFASIIGYSIMEKQIPSFQSSPTQSLYPTKSVIITQDSAILKVTVTDSGTKKPVINAIVYLGRGDDWKCFTNNEGKCQIITSSRGNYGLGVYKKGCERFTKSIYLEKGQNDIIVELKQLSIPETLQIEGTIIEIITDKGTMSENHYFKIKDFFGKEEYLFNYLGENVGFDKYINKRTKITGYKQTGHIGWMGRDIEGIYVEKIE